MNRRTFLSSTAAAFAAGRPLTANSRTQSPDNTPGFLLEEHSISDLQSAMKSRNLTAESIIAAYLQRIEEIDRSGPKLNAIIELNPDALSLARELDAERRSKGPRGPLHGIPLVIKDNIDTADKMQTTAGSLALVGKPAPADAPLVTRLRAAGAILLGKTNLSEWANFRSTHSTSGWSGRGGQTKNPYALNRNPCGSSSGTGAAVSANLATAGIGTETDGSVVCPSSMCGLVGMKPTLGLISGAGIIPIAHSQDTAGPMARSVTDVALLLGVLANAGPQPGDAADTPGIGYSDYTRFLNPQGLKGARLGIARQYFTMGPAVTAAMDAAIQMMRQAGAVIIDPVEFHNFENWRDTETSVLLYEFKADLTAYLTRRAAPVRSLADCIAFNKEHTAQEMPFFAQELMEQAQEKGPLSDKHYRKALKTNHHLTRKEGIDALISKFQLDAIVGPTAGPAWITDLISGDHADSGCASPPAVAGYPHITVPVGTRFGLPLGLSFFGPAWSEPKLLALAYSFEQLSRARRKPEFLPTVNFSA